MKIFIVFFCVIISCNGFDFNAYSIETIKRVLTNILDKSDNTQCTMDLKEYVNGVFNWTNWALEMFDATAKIESGIMSGNIRQLGNYDECLNIYVKYNDTEIRGKYCGVILSGSDKYKKQLGFLSSAVKFIEARGVKLTRRKHVKSFDLATVLWAVCIPHSCNESELQQIWDYSEYYLDTKIHLNFNDELCSIKNDVKFTTSAIITCCIFASFAIIIVMSTIYDINFYQKLDTKKENIYMAFSLYTNGLKLFSMKTSPHNLECINGIRVLSMLWVILGHTAMHSVFMPNINGIYLNEWKDHYENVLLTAGPMAVDTFFTISGLLVVFIYLYATQYKKSKVSIPQMYIHRILRLSPSLMMMVLLYGTLIRHLGDGPLWPVMYLKHQKSCEEYWWSTLLFINNYYHTSKQCVSQSWYLAVDTQLFALSPIIIIPFYKWPKITILGISLVGLSSSITAFIITYTKDIGCTNFDASEEYFNEIYYPAHIRVTPYLVGAVGGYYLYKFKNTKLVMKKLILFGGWLISAIILYVVLFSFIFLQKFDYDNLLAGAFNAFARPAWAVMICWVIFVCVHRYGGFVNSLLSLPIFRILSRTNYSMYLTHMLVQLVFVYQKRHPDEYSNLKTYYEFCGFVMMTFFVSTIWTLAFESPIIIIENIIFHKDKPNIETTIIDIKCNNDVSK